MEGDRFDAAKIKRGKFNDSTFINKLFKDISPVTHKILFKPYTDLCSPDGMAPLIINWKTLLKNKGFSNDVLFTDSTEDNYFGDISLKQFAVERSKIAPPPPPPPPPPPNIIVTEDGKPIPGRNEDAFYVKAKNVVTFLLSANGSIYYYEGIFAGSLRKTDLNFIGKLITQYKGKIPLSDLMFIIKSDKVSSTKNMIDLLDEMTINKIPIGHYAQIDITENEIKSINNYKEN